MNLSGSSLKKFRADISRKANMKATIDIREFKRIMKVLKPFTTTDTNVAILQFIQMKFDEATQEVKCEAIDGRKVAVEYLKCTTDVSFTAYIKPVTLMKTAAEFATIEQVDDVTMVDFMDYTLKFKNVPGEWINTRPILDQSELGKCMKFGVNPNYIKQAVDSLIKNDSFGKTPVIFEVFHAKSPVFIRDEKDRRNVRLVLPVNIKGLED